MDATYRLRANTLDAHKDTVVGCLRVRERGRGRREVRRWGTTTAELLKLADWLRQAGWTHVAMEVSTPN
jgi:transposase